MAQSWQQRLVHLQQLVHHLQRQCTRQGPGGGCAIEESIVHSR